MVADTGRRMNFIQELLIMASAPLLAYWLCKMAISHLDPDAGQKEEARQKASAATRRLEGILADKQRIEDEHDREKDGYDSRDRRRKKDLHLTSYEQTIAMEVVEPEGISVSFEDIGGLDDIIEELKESVIYPLTMPHLYAHSSSLLSAPSGVLLYGPPGCGKTMLAKALAHESGACFINLQISTLTEKWYGDSNKLVNAVFSLARKLQPSIVFIDEIDAVLGTRRSGEHEASGMVKAEFMTLWDGLSSSNSSGEPQRICVLGATNRIQDIDEAILRRMPKKFPVSLPTAMQRRRIFTLILRDTKIDRPNFNLAFLVRVTAGMSGSDIKEACRDAAMCPVREYIKQKRAAGELRHGVDPREVRGIRTGDFFGAAQSQRKMQEVDEDERHVVVEEEEEETISENKAAAAAAASPSSSSSSSTTQASTESEEDVSSNGDTKPEKDR